MMPRRAGKDTEFLKEDNIVQWYKNVGRGSETTADVYLRRLRGFCETVGLGPNEVLKLDADALFNMVLDFIDHEEKRGCTGSYTESSIKAVKSWLSHFNIRIERKIKIRGTTRTPTLDDERVPTQEELRKIILSGTVRGRLSCALMAHSGVRPEVMGNYRGDDGLRIKDIPEMIIEGKEVSFEEIPTLLIVRPELSKAGHKYITFISEEACEFLKTYLEDRLIAGDVLEPDTDLLTPIRAQKDFIRSAKISRDIRNAIRKAGFSWRPYVLRAYFDTQLLMAESKGHITHTYRQFFMGHKGDMESRYTTNKGRLTDEMIEDMREAYRRCEEFLVSGIVQKKDDSRVTVFRNMLIAIGYSEEDISRMDLDTMDDETIQDIFKQRFMPIPDEVPNQKIVHKDELGHYLNDGWRFCSNMGDGEVIINPPTHMIGQ